MSKYDVYSDPGGKGYLVDVQADLLDSLNTRMVVPLLPRGEAPIPAAHLNPIFEVEGQEVVMVTQFMAAVPVSILKNPVGHLDEAFEQITRATDMLLQGF